MPFYLAWTKRFDVLPKDFDVVRDAVDIPAIDKAYYESHWRGPVSFMKSVNLYQDGTSNLNPEPRLFNPRYDAMKCNRTRR